jgi:hypothetical protein
MVGNRILDSGSKWRQLIEAVATCRTPYLMSRTTKRLHVATSVRLP